MISSVAARGWTCAVLIIGCSNAVAQQKAASANPFLAAAERLYRNFEFAEALKAADKAATWQGNTPADEVRATLMQAIINAQLGRTEKALAAFKRALAVDADATLPFRVSPKIAQLYERARRETPAPAKGAQPVAATEVTPPPLPPPPPPAVVEPAEPAPAVVPVTEAPAAVTQTAAPTATSSSPRSLSWIPAAVGVAAAGVGAYFFVQAKSDSDQLTGTSVLTLPHANQLVSNGKMSEGLGWAGVGVGAAALAFGIALFIAGGPSSTNTSVAVSPTPTGVGIAGDFP
jgi:hypothetical protein